MAKAKKVSIRSIENTADELFNDTTVLDWHGTEITITRTISLQDMLSFVENVTKSCFSDDDNKYLPEVKDFLIKIYTLQYYTNVNIPQTIDGKYKMVYSSDLVDYVQGAVNEYQYMSMLRAIDEKLKYMAASRIEEINRQIVGLSENIDDLTGKIKELFEGVSGKDIENVFGAMANGGIDEEKLMNAYLANKK